MEKINTYPDLLYFYYLSYKEIVRNLLSYKYYSYLINKTFHNQEMVNTLKSAIDDYLINVYQELKIIKFMLKNVRKLYCADVYGILNKINDNFKNRYEYYDNIFKNLEDALDMKLDYKFYIPRKRYDNLTDKDVENYINYAKGFNVDRIKEFLEEEKVLNVDDFDEIYEQAKKISGDAKDNIDFFGVYDKGLVIPQIKDETSTLIALHEIIHLVMIKFKDKLEATDDILCSEDLPILYELVFKKDNRFIKNDVHTTPKALELLKTYQSESLKTQIKKLKEIK